MGLITCLLQHHCEGSSKKKPRTSHTLDLFHTSHCPYKFLAADCPRAKLAENDPPKERP